MPVPKGTVLFEDDVIADLIARTEKGEPLTQVCELPRMPARRTVYDWLEQDEVFAARFHAARARGIHALAEDCLAIADVPAKDPTEVADKRLRIDTRLRLAGKWLPSVYGDKTTTEVTGKDGGPIRSETTMDLSALTPDQLRAIASIKLPADA